MPLIPVSGRWKKDQKPLARQKIRASLEYRKPFLQTYMCVCVHAHMCSVCMFYIICNIYIYTRVTGV